MRTGDLSRFGRRSVGLLLGMLIVTAPAVVLANHQFNDVATSHPFHDEIDAIAKAGITAGFPDGGYHPSEPVTRQAMAAFMERGFGRAAHGSGGAPLTSAVEVGGTQPSSSVVPVRQLTIDVPGTSTPLDPRQFVYVQGHVTFASTMTTNQGCPCSFKVFIRDTEDDVAVFEQAQTFHADYSGFHGFEVQGLFMAAPGPHTYRMDVQLTNRSVGISMAPESFPISELSSLSVMTFPFGVISTGEL